MMRHAMLALLLLLPCGSLAQDDTLDHQARLEKSLQAWETLKKECGGNYSYRVSWSSFTGFGHETVVVVQRNRVVERHFREFNRRRPPTGDRPDLASWIENKRQLSSHKRGAPALTLDQLYGQAEKVLQRELTPNVGRYLRFDKQGLLLSCFDVDRRIADDAPRRGVAITSIELEKKRPPGKK